MVGAAHALLLHQIADRLEAQQRSVIAGGSEDQSADDLAWADALAMAMKHAVSTPADLVELARICRCVRDNPAGTPEALRDILDLKLQTSVVKLLGHTKTADVELMTLHDHFMALEYQGRTLSQVYADDDDAGDEARETLIRQQKTIVCELKDYSPVSLPGCQAVARMLLVWDHHIRPTENDVQPGEHQLLWLLLRGLLGAEQATALASDNSDIVLKAIGSKLDRGGLADTRMARNGQKRVR